MQSGELVEQFERNRKRAEYRMTFANRCVDQRDAMRLRRGGSMGSVEGVDDRQGIHVMK
jgi:hypothetical protein